MRELRAISFTPRELTTALIEFSHRLHRKLPSGTVLDSRVDEGPPIAVTVPIQDDHGTVHDVKFMETEVAAALVHYCMGRKVKMPARGEKILQIIAGTATLVIWLSNARESRRMVRPTSIPR